MSATTVRLSRAAIVLAAFAVLAVGILAGAGATALLYVLPALLLFGVLLAGRYPGEETLVRMRRPQTRGRRRTVASSKNSPGRHAIVTPRGGLLIAFALAVRPPPCPAALS